MNPIQDSAAWNSSQRLIASEKWKAKSAAMGRGVTDALVAYAKPKAGMRVLDVASGTGEPAISLASVVGPEGHVTATDLNAELLEIAAQRARERGLANFVTRQADAHDLPFPDQSFDLVTCRFGVMFFADPDRALKELHRVLKLGARACFVAWGPFDQPYWRATMGLVVKHVGGPAITLDAQDPFKFGQAGSLAAILRRAGFQKVEEETKTVPWIWPGTAEELWEYAQAVAAPFRPLLDRVPEEKRDEINRDVYAAIRLNASRDSVKFEVEVVLASVVKS